MDKTILKEGFQPNNSSLIFYMKRVKLFYDVELLIATYEASAYGFCYGVNNINIENSEGHKTMINKSLFI